MENYNNVKFKKVIINGKEVQFTDECKIDKLTIPEGMFTYDIRHSDYSFTNPATIEPRVFVNWFGTIVTDEEYEFDDPHDKYIKIETFKFI